MKYKLTENKKEFDGVILFQIISASDFGNVKSGQIGGWIEKEKNLSQSGDAWVYDNAQVYGNAWVSGNARVYENAQVYENVWVYGDARVYDNAWVYDNARVYENALVYGDARVYENARVSGNAQVSFDALKEKYVTIGQFGVNYRHVTATKQTVYCGCFEGGLEAFKYAVKNKYGQDFGSYAPCIELLENFMK